VRHRLHYERTYLHNPFAGFGLFVRLDGPVGPGLVEAAIRRVCACIEVLHCRIEQDADGGAFLVGLAGSSDTWADIRMADGDVSAAGLYYDAMREPFDLVHGPLIRFVVGRTGPSQVAMLAYVHHAVADGRSLATVVGEVLRLLDDPTAAPVRFPVSVLDTTALLEGVDLPRTMRAMVKLMAGAGLPAVPVADLPELRRDVTAYLATHEVGVDVMTLACDTLDALLMSCRQHGVSLTSALMAGLLLADTCLEQVHLPVSLRGKDDVCVGNWVIVVAVPRPAVATVFWEYCRAIHSQLTAILSDRTAMYSYTKFLLSVPPGALDAAYDSHFRGVRTKVGDQVSALLGYTHNLRSVGLSNIGSFWSRLTHVRVREVVFLPPFNANQRYVTGIVSHAGGLTIAIIGGGRDGAGTLARVRDALIGALRD